MSLTKAAVYIKRALFIGVVVFFLYYLIFFVLFPRARLMIARLLPEREPPNMIFGKLPLMEFEKKELENYSIRYELNTRGGLLPVDFPKKMTVYKFKSIPFSYLAGTNAQNNAKMLGFDDKDLVSDLKGDVFQWKHTTTGSVLRIDLATRELILDSDFEEIQTPMERNAIDRNTTQQRAVDILKKLNRYDSTFDDGLVFIDYGKYLGYYTVIANEQEKANFAKVSLSKKVNDYKVYGSDPKEGIAMIYLGYNSESPSPLNYPRMYVNYKEIDLENNGTYPIMFIEDVWNNVKKGKGVISGVYPNNRNPFEEYEKTDIDRIIVNDIFLAYYENTSKYHTFLQPIYVFHGKYTSSSTNVGGEVYVYYPAVIPEYIDSGQAD